MSKMKQEFATRCLFDCNSFHRFPKIRHTHFHGIEMDGSLTEKTPHKTPSEKMNGKSLESFIRKVKLKDLFICQLFNESKK
jgi:hypothetical protein